MRPPTLGSRRRAGQRGARASVSNLFSRAYFRAVREHLREGGVLVLACGADKLLRASERPLVPSPEALDALQDVVSAAPAIGAGQPAALAMARDRIARFGQRQPVREE